MEAVFINNTNHPDTGAISAGVKLLCPLDTTPVAELDSSVLEAMAKFKQVSIKLRKGTYTYVKSRETNAIDPDGNEKEPMLQCWYKAPVNDKPFQLTAPETIEAPSSETVQV